VNIDEVNRGIEAHKKPRRIGRGIGSGQGKTAGKGHKGQRSRAGASRKPTFQGGQMPLVRRIPKRGFNNSFADLVAVVNLSDLEKHFQAGEEVTPETLRAKKLARARWDVLKILGQGELTKSLKISAHRFSATAREKIEKVGGEVAVIPMPTTVAEKRKVLKKQKGQDAAGASS
jgi:large subunit ribosomal protein L15